MPTPPVQYHELHALVERQCAAWNAGDADAWSACFSEDAAFVNILGMPLDGRAQIAERHGVMFQTVFAGSRCEAAIEHVARLGNDGVVARIGLVVTGQRMQPPGIQATDADGTLRTRMLYVLRRVPDGQWTVVAAQNTAIAPTAWTTMPTR